MPRGGELEGKTQGASIGFKLRTDVIESYLSCTGAPAKPLKPSQSAHSLPGPPHLCLLGSASRTRNGQGSAPRQRPTLRSSRMESEAEVATNRTGICPLEALPPALPNALPHDVPPAASHSSSTSARIAAGDALWLSTPQPEHPAEISLKKALNARRSLQLHTSRSWQYKDAPPSRISQGAPQVRIVWTSLRDMLQRLNPPTAAAKSK